MPQVPRPKENVPASLRHENQPYIVPVYLAYDAATPDAPSLYGVATFGTKVEWMRENPRVCVEVDDITDFDHWVSVVVLGRYEELQGQPEEAAKELRRPTPPVEERREPSSHATGKRKAVEVLQDRAMWWEPSTSAWSSRRGERTDKPTNPSITAYGSSRFRAISANANANGAAV